MTLVEMLEALEAGIVRLHTSNGDSPPPPAASRVDLVRAGALRMQMERAGLTPVEFSSIFGIAPNLVDNWLSGRDTIPAWVESGIQMLAMIPPSARRKLRNHVPRTPDKKPARSHPFSRIEEL